MCSEDKPIIPILFQDEHYVVVHKPHNLLVHRTKFSDDKIFLLQTLRDQIGKHLYPVHRLDRPTAGVLLMALHSEAARKIKIQFDERTLEKNYWLVARGYTEEQGLIDKPLQETKDKPLQEAKTEFKTLKTVELPFAVGRYQTARYSLVEAKPLTGRMHQIRKHFASHSHPIIGDRLHGDGKHNLFLREHLQVHRLLLLARSLQWQHPYTNEIILSESLIDEDWLKVLALFAMQLPL